MKTENRLLYRRILKNWRILCQQRSVHVNHDWLMPKPWPNQRLGQNAYRIKITILEINDEDTSMMVDH